MLQRHWNIHGLCPRSSAGNVLLNIHQTKKTSRKIRHRCVLLLLKCPRPEAPGAGKRLRFASLGTKRRTRRHQRRKRATELPGVTDQAHTPTPTGAAGAGPSQLWNNHTTRAAVEGPHHGKSAEGDSLERCFPAQHHPAIRQHSPREERGHQQREVC